MNPEGLYAFTTEEGTYLVPRFEYGLTNTPGMRVPHGTFARVVKRWDGEPISYKGFTVKEVRAFAKDGKLVPRKYRGQKASNWYVKISYRGRWLLLWRVTWDVVVHNARSKQ